MTDERRVQRAARLLGVVLGREEGRVVARELEELRIRRGRGRLWFWWSLAGYPLRTAGEAVREWRRAPSARGGVEGLRGDVGYAFRGLRSSPGFTLTVVLILASAMGATTALYSVVRGVLLDPLPYPEADRLHAVWIQGDDGDRGRMTPGNFRDLGELDVFTSVAAFSGTSAALQIQGEGSYVQGGRVTAGYFETLGIPLVLGRGIQIEDEDPNGSFVVVLGHGLWERAFGADPGIVGRTVDFNDTPFRVVGVAGPGLYPTNALVSAEIPFTHNAQDFFIPLWYSAEGWTNRRSHVLGMVARRAPGVSAEVAGEALQALSARLRETEPLNASESFVLTPLEEEITGGVRFALLTLLGMVGLVLVIAVVNVGALFLLRADDRSSDVQIRRALGAPWGRITRQLVTESTLVVAAAGLLAVWIARGGVELMQRVVPYQIPRMEGVEVDGGVLAASVAAGAVLALLLGTAPAWRLVRDLRSGSRRGATVGRGSRRLQQGVVLVQSALGVVVLVGALLLGRSFAQLRSVDPGFQALDAWVFEVRGIRVETERLVEVVRAVPGVRTAAITYDHPLERNWEDGFLLPDLPPDPDRSPAGSLRPFGAGYFDAAGIPVVEGTLPTEAEFAGEARLAVVNRSFRDTWFPDRSPIGRTLVVPSVGRRMGEDAADFTIAAVVEDVRFLGPERGSEPAFYLPLEHFDVGWSSLVVRPETPSVEVAGAVAGAIRELAPGSSVESAQRLRDLLSAALARPRFNMALLVSFGVMALALCGLGTYGLVGRVVASGRREIGIRIALGAPAREVAGVTLGQALRPLMVGVVAGLVVAWLASGLLASLLFRIVPGDPASFVLGALFMVSVGAVAGLVPTLQALGIDPGETLREE